MIHVWTLHIHVTQVTADGDVTPSPVLNLLSDLTIDLHNNPGKAMLL